MRSLLLFSAFVCAGIASADLTYHLSPEPAGGTIRVSVDVDAVGAFSLKMPAWSPGFYVIQDFGRQVSDVRAVDGKGRRVSVNHPTANEWSFAPFFPGKITVSYRVLGNDPGLGFFGVHVDDRTTYINGAAAFMYEEGHKDEPHHLKVTLPSGWDMATPMDPEKDGYVAGGYDEFIDHPIQLGIFRRKTFEVNSIPFQAIFVSPTDNIDANLDDEAARLALLAKPAMSMMGGTSFKRYMVLFHLAVGNFNGGLEHRSANVEAVSPPSGRIVDDTLFTHEFFHAWNVKQIRPSVLGPFNYDGISRTGNLWFSEGVTDYYAQICAYRSAAHDAGWLLSQMAEQVTELQRANLRKTMTVEECSRKIWENGGISVGDFSYYNKGLLIGWILDGAIRSATQGQKSLDDVMRLLYTRTHLPQPGFGEDDLRKTVNEVAGTDLSDLYNKMVRSTDELPYEVLKGIGLVVRPNGSGWEVQTDPNATEEAARLRGQWLAH